MSTDPSPWRQGLAWYAASTAVVLAGVGYAAWLHPGQPWPVYFARWDGENYARVCRDGYFYDPERHSPVAFLPGYPAPAAVLLRLTGISAELALVLVANLALAGAFVALAAYVRERWPDADADRVRAVLLAFGFFPPTFYFRMAYSESLFVLCLLLAFLGMRRRWPVLVIALLAGAATAVRLVGVAALPAFLLHLARRSPDRRVFVGRALGLMPVACWGTLAFMTYTGLAFAAPLAVVHNVGHWSQPDKQREPKLAALVTLRPLWCNFDPASPCHRSVQDPHGQPWTGLHLGNPIWFTAAGLLLLGGGLRGRLDGPEGLLAAGLWLIPYATRCHEMCMGGAARYAAVIFPLYLLLGQLGGRLPRWAGFALVAGGAGLLLIYSFKFARFADPYFY